MTDESIKQQVCVAICNFFGSFQAATRWVSRPVAFPEWLLRFVTLGFDL